MSSKNGIDERVMGASMSPAGVFPLRAADPELESRRVKLVKTESE